MTSEGDKRNASQSLLFETEKKKKEKETRVPVTPDSGKKKKKRGNELLLLPQMRLSNEWRGGLAFVAASLRFDNATFVFEIRDDRTLLPFYNRAFSHAFARIFFSSL